MKAVDWTRPSLILGLATLALHLLANGGYGIFRDELYFIVCGQHLAWGYVDQPPLVPLIAALSHAAFGDFVTGFRLMPTLVWSATVALSVEFAGLIGGGRFAQWLTGLCVLGAPAYLIFGMFVSTDMLQPLTWLGVSWCLVKIAKGGDDRWWIPLGVITAIGLLTKYEIAFYIVVLGIGALFTPLRRSLARPWVYIGATLGFVIMLPNFLWQQSHGWPFLELAAAGINGKNIPLSPLAFFAQQALAMGPVSAPIWLIGLWAFAVRPVNPSYRIFPVAFVLMAIFFIAEHGKANYLIPAYTVLFAGGAVFIESKLRVTALRYAALAFVALEGMMLAPIALPVLPEESFIAYAASIGVGPSATAGERLKQGRLPQYFADMHGWPEMAAKIAAVYHALPPTERPKAVFFGHNYGEAAAIDVFGRRLGLPPAISGHNNYWLWGPQGRDGSVMIVIGGDRADYESKFRSVKVVGRIDSLYAMPYETDKPIYVLRGLKVPLLVLWPKLKHYE